MNEDVILVVEYIVYFWNRRIESIVEIYGILENNMIYYCVVREKENFIIIEEFLYKIVKEEIKNVKKRSENLIEFLDKYGEYIFNIFKSVLMKKFFFKEVVKRVEVRFEIIENLIDLIENFVNILIEFRIIFLKLYVILFLYFYDRRRNKYVLEYSGLN